MTKDGNKTWLVFSGSKIPAFVLDGGRIFSTKTLFREGIKRFAMWSEGNEDQFAVCSRFVLQLGFKVEQGFTICAVIGPGLSHTSGHSGTGLARSKVYGQAQ